MFIRDHKGHIVNIDEPKFTNDKELYLHLWFAQYNIVIGLIMFRTYHKARQNFLLRGLSKLLVFC